MADEPGDWSRQSGTELFAYASLQDRLSGGNTLNEGGALRFSYTYFEPNNKKDRFLVIRNVYITPTATPLDAQVGVAFVRWKEATTGIFRTTAGPVVGNYGRYKVDQRLGFLLTKPPTNAASVKLQECYSSWPGHDDYLVTGDNGTSCRGGDAYKRLRTAGWAYAVAQPNTVPLYRCYNAIGKFHFAATTETCDGQGKKEWLLGYILAQ